MPDRADLTVVLCGPVIEEGPWPTSLVVERARTIFSPAAIVLSTWEGTSLEIDGVEVVKSADPGPLASEDPAASNLARVHVASRAGLDAVRTNWTLRCRSDLLFLSDRALELASAVDNRARQPEFAIFDEAVVCATAATRLPRHGGQFWVSDWFHLGRTEDLRSLFFATDELPTDLVAEQVGWAHLVADRQDLPIATLFAVDAAAKFRLTRRFLVNNFVPTPSRGLGFVHLKYPAAARFAIHCVGPATVRAWSQEAGLAPRHDLGVAALCSSAHELISWFDERVHIPSVVAWHLISPLQSWRAKKRVDRAMRSG